MAKLSHAASRRMYSWWWDSHISPKNSKWLQENLIDTDAKVKSMIKLIEQDADSFARRAEMYYEKRPELMKMVEEFYRAYRALAERYDHATGALRQAHRTMTQAFPNENDELASDATENDPQTPDDDSIGSGDDLKFGEQKMNRGINFNEVEKDRKLEMEIETLRKVLAKFEVEKESSLAQYKQSIKNLSHQEFEFSNAKEDSKALAEQANKTEDEVKSLRKALKALEVEKEKSLVQYQKCREKIEKDAFDLNERAHKAETEAQILKLDLAKMESEKEQFLEKIFDLENMLELAEDDAKKLNKRNEEAEIKVETLKQALVELGVEKEATTAKSKQCLDTISSLELKLSSSQEKVQMLNSELESEVANLKGAQEQGLNLEKLNQSLHLELETLKLEMGAQSDELTEKKREMDILRTSAQEKQLSLAETEAAVQALQLVNAEAEEQLHSLSLELQNRSLIISNLETRNQSLLNESLKIKDENKNLNELNSASSVSINDMKSKILSLGDAKEKLEKEVGLQLEQRSALQQEKSRLQEELNDHNKMYLAILDQVEAVGFSSECFQSAVKDLQDENLNLKETQERELREKVDILKKLENLEMVIQEKAVLDKSLSDLSADLECTREEIIAREKSFQSLSEEKFILHSEKDSLETQLHVTTENMEKLREKYIIMENSISETHNAIEGLMMRIKIMEDSYRLLENEKSDLINKEDTLVSQVEITRRTLQDIEKRYQELEEKHSVLEKEKESTQCEVEELQLIVKEGKLKAAKQIIEIDNLHGKVLDMQKTSVTLQEENLKLIDEKISRVKDFLDFQENHDSIEFLKEKVSVMEGENGGIRAQLAAYVPAISSLKDCISSLENSTCFYMQLGNNDDEKVKAANENHAECHEESSVDQKERVKLSELQDLEARIKAVEKTISEKNSKLEAATRQIEKLMSNGALSQDSSKPLTVNSESQNGTMTKDIMLDQISDCYSQGIKTVYSIAKLNRKGNITTQPKEGIDFNLGLTVEKELDVDKLASENRFSLPKQEVDKTKVLERLKTDSQKLIDLQITVQNLKKKLEISENRVEGKSFGECERIGGLLGKSEEDIMLLSDLNGKLLRSVDKSDDEKDVVESEQARKVSKRIGQLQLEVNEIQSIILKLDGENGEEKIKRKTEITEAKKRTSVRNYLGLRTSNRKNKRSFCGFVYPPTTED